MTKRGWLWGVLGLALVRGAAGDPLPAEVELTELRGERHKIYDTGRIVNGRKEYRMQVSTGKIHFRRRDAAGALIGPWLEVDQTQALETPASYVYADLADGAVVEVEKGSLTYTMRKGLHWLKMSGPPAVLLSREGEVLRYRLPDGTRHRIVVGNTCVQQSDPSGLESNCKEGEHQTRITGVSVDLRFKLVNHATGKDIGIYLDADSLGNKAEKGIHKNVLKALVKLGGKAAVKLSDKATNLASAMYMGHQLFLTVASQAHGTVSFETRSCVCTRRRWGVCCEWRWGKPKAGSMSYTSDWSTSQGFVMIHPDTTLEQVAQDLMGVARDIGKDVLSQRGEDYFQGRHRDEVNDLSRRDGGRIQLVPSFE